MRSPLEALTAGKVDICVAALPSVLQAQLDGHTVKILCNFYQKGSAVVTAATKGIDSIEKLAGKTVGYTDGTMEYAQLRADLYNRQMDANAITWKEMAPVTAQRRPEGGNNRRVLRRCGAGRHGLHAGLWENSGLSLCR